MNPKPILVVDNYDSFVNNLARYFECLGQQTIVVRNDAIGFKEIEKLSPKAIVLSPGPSTPEKAGNTIQLVQKFHARFPILGICLGHQAIVAAFGGAIIRTSYPVHGMSDQITTSRCLLYDNLPLEFSVGRYHSLVAEKESLPQSFRITAENKEGIIMSIEHKAYPTVGIQYHPESILTENGKELLANFLAYSFPATSSSTSN
ncbi:MAG: aminodeoxychorismate/anthranilate synthase component II [Pirellulaceae bacterium]|nr:aminodeoxychorismate/anthranilate synthase component II [Pirellulaceae bacterium]